MTTAESADHIDPNSPSYHDGGHKKPSIFGRLKDKTKKAGSKIKHKVGKKKTNPDGTTTVDNEDEGEEMSSNSDVRIQYRYLYLVLEQIYLSNFFKQF